VSAAEREKWDARYRDGAYESRTHPTALLAEWLPRLPRGRALDVACGAGRNALYLAANGYSVTALDISRVALDRGRRAAAERGLAVEWLCADLDEDPEHALPVGAFDLIVWVRYVHSTLMPHLVARLAVGGALVCEQHFATGAAVAGPRSAEFRLPPGALRRSAQGLRVAHAYEGPVVDPDGRSVALTQLIAHKTA
jgi:tellurite methyltransferase